MAEKIIGVEVKSLVYDIEDSKTRSIAENALSNANSAAVKADETASALAPVAQSVAEIEANIGSNDISEIASNASAALEATEEIPPLQEKIGDVDISAAGDSVTDAISKMNEILGNVSGAVYSTEEKAVGKWIDGRTVYQKTISIPAGTYSGVFQFPFGVPDLDFIVAFDGVLIRSEGFTIPLPFSSGGDWTYNLQIDCTGGNIRFISNNTTTDTQGAYVTCKYVKKAG